MSGDGRGLPNPDRPSGRGASDGGAIDERQLIDRVVSGRNRDLQMLAAQGVLPLQLANMLALQVALILSEDLEVATTAQKALEELKPTIVADTLEECEDPRVLAYFAATATHDLVLRSLIRNRGIQPDLLAEMAPSLPADLQEAFLLRQDLIVGHPELLDRLEENSDLSSFSRRRTAEYREHLLARVPEESQESEAELLEVDPAAASIEETEAALEEARSDATDEGEKEDTTGLSEAQIKILPMPVRLRLTYGASLSLKQVLIRDTSPVVAMSVLKNNSWSELEIERIAGNKLVASEILEYVGRSRQWIQKTGIVRALAKNPRTPTAMALRFLPRLGVRDLQQITREHGTSAVVKSTATRLYRMRRT